MKRNKNSGRKNKNKHNVPARLKRIVNTSLVSASLFRSLGTSARKTIIETLTIDSVAASPTIRFSTYSQSYYNLLNITSIPDFSNLVNDFEAIKITSVTMQVRRVIPEGSTSSVYSTYMKPVYIAYYPTKVSYAPGSTGVLARESSMVVDPMLVTTQVASYKLPNVSVPVTAGGVTYTFNMAFPLPISNAGAIPGCLVLGMDNATNAAISTPLYSIRIIFDVVFLFPF